MSQPWRDIKPYQELGYELKKVQPVIYFLKSRRDGSTLSKLDVDKHISVEIELMRWIWQQAESKATYAQL